MAAVSVGIADAVAHFMPGAGDRLRQRVRMGDAPEKIVRTLAELLAEDLSEWPAGAWLVIDDYHLVRPSKAADEFVDWLLMLTPIRLLITTRQRPRWATARRLLQGEIFELTKDQLAMTKAEANEVLSSRPPASVRALIEKAEGWPVLLGLAALVASDGIPESDVAQVLFRYLAEEVFLAEPDDVRRFLVIAAVPCSFDIAFARDVAGIGDPQAMFSYLAARGLLQGTPTETSLHPLLREFLTSRARSLLPEDEFEAVHRQCIATSRGRKAWDSALEIACRLDDLDLMAGLLEEASPSFLRTGRLETFSAWLDEVSDLDERPGLLLARADLFTRIGRFREAARLAEQVSAAGAGHENDSHARLLAAQAYYLVSDPRRALQSSDAARSNARSPHTRKDALWRRFSAARELNLPDLGDYLNAFSEAAGASLDDRLRMASGSVMLGSQAGTFAGLWKSVKPLLHESSSASDPLIASGALVSFCYLAIGRADYLAARKLVQALTTKCQEHRIDFAVGFCTAIEANAELGLRNFNRCQELLRELAVAADEHEDPYITVEWHIAQARLDISQGRFDLRPVETWEPYDPEAFQLYIAHYLSLLALAAAAAGESRKAEALAERALGTAHTVETLGNTEWARVIATGGSSAATRELAVDVLTAQHQRDYLDSFVLAYRAVPSLLDLISDHPVAVPIASRALKASRDATVAGYGRILAEERPGSNEFGLTPREREVWALLGQGFTNAEIARRLFISHSTAKVHVHHILRKLGVENRLQAALAFSQSHWSELASAGQEERSE